jgi:hypothetical protein
VQPAVSALHTQTTLLAHNHDKQDNNLVQSLTMIGSPNLIVQVTLMT